MGACRIDNLNEAMQTYALLLVAFAVLDVGTWLSWESAAFARQRSAVRIRSSPPTTASVTIASFRGILLESPADRNLESIVAHRHLR